MRAVVQRVLSAEVTVNGETAGRIGRGLVVLLGVAKGDTEKEAEWMARKLGGLRVFEDSDGKMNLDLVQAEGALLMVSNFTVCGDASKGRRPSFDKAAGFEDGRELFDSCVRSLRESGLEVETGRYGERMQVSLVNDGPVTLVIDSPGGER